MNIASTYDYFLRFWIYVFDRLFLYPLLKWYSKKYGCHFLNLGYLPSKTCSAHDDKIIRTVQGILNHPLDPNIPHYYLYEKTLSFHPSYPTFPEYHILEVGCGQGEGISWIERAHSRISRITGIDPIPQNRINVYQGFAEKIPIPENSYDIVLNIESSHLYKDCAQFFRECYRILKPGGSLCWSDLRYVVQTEELKKQAKMAGLCLQHWSDITENVLLGITQTSKNYDKLIERGPFPLKFFKQSLRLTYCAPGTETYAKYVNGTKGYYTALWQKK